MAEAESEPEVIVDFDFEGGLLFVGVRNLGERPALEVSTRFDKPFRGLGGARKMNGLALFKRIEFLAPGKEIRSLLDSSAAYFARHEPTDITVTVTYADGSGTSFKDAMHHDLGIYRDVSYVSPRRLEER